MTSLRLAASIVSANSSSTPASPSRLRQRVRLDGSIGAWVWRYGSPVKIVGRGFPPNPTSSSDKLKAYYRYSKPAMSRGELAGRPLPEVKLSLINTLSRSQLIKPASCTNGCSILICLFSGYRNKSPVLAVAFGPIFASLQIAGFIFLIGHFLAIYVTLFRRKTFTIKELTSYSRPTK